MILDARGYCSCSAAFIHTIITLHGVVRLYACTHVGIYPTDAFAQRLAGGKVYHRGLHFIIIKCNTFYLSPARAATFHVLEKMGFNFAARRSLCALANGISPR